MGGVGEGKRGSSRRETGESAGLIKEKNQMNAQHKKDLYRFMSFEGEERERLLIGARPKGVDRGKGRRGRQPIGRTTTPEGRDDEKADNVFCVKKNWERGI